jgi:hypothetical protein
MRGVRRKTDKESFPFYLGKKDVKTGSELNKFIITTSICSDLRLFFLGNCPLEPVMDLTTQASSFRL